MRPEEITTIKSHVRDINLGLLTKDYKVKYDISQQYGVFQLNF